MIKLLLSLLFNIYIMPTARAFAYNPFETVPPGCTQYGNLAIQHTGWTVGAGGLHWYNGPDEDPGYVIAYVANPPKTAATYTENITAMSVGFRRTSVKSAVEFWNLAEQVTGQVFSGAQNARTYLLANGYWTSFSGGPPDPGGDGIVLDGLTLRLDASNSSSYNGSGTTWFDISGTQENITLVNNPGWVSSSPNYFEFYGNEYGTGTQSVISATQYTKSIWFQRTSPNTDGNLVSSQTGGHFMYFGPDIENSNIHCGHTDWGDYQAFPSNTQILLNTWYCVTLTFDTTNGMKLYIDGVLDATYNSILTPVPGDLSTNIAAFGTGNTLTGKINKVYCYNRVLTDSEVLQNYFADVIEFA
jgi:hypothetical protein